MPGQLDVIAAHRLERRAQAEVSEERRRPDAGAHDRRAHGERPGIGAQLDAVAARGELEHAQPPHARAARDRRTRQGLADSARIEHVAGVGKLKTRDGVGARGAGHRAQQLWRRRCGRDAEPLHAARLGGRFSRAGGGEPDLVVAVAAQERPAPDLAQRALPRRGRGSHQRRKLPGVGTLTEGGGGEAPRPGRKLRQPAPREVERASEHEQLPPEAEQQCRGRQGLDQLSAEVPRVAEARSPGAGLRRVGEHHRPTLASEAPGDRTADDSGADHRDRVLFPHESIVYDLRSHAH